MRVKETWLSKKATICQTLSLKAVFELAPADTLEPWACAAGAAVCVAMDEGNELDEKKTEGEIYLCR
jgi:hypothetical protein